MDYYATPHKLFVKQIHDKIVTHDESSADDQLIEILNQKDNSLKYISFDVPLSLPGCFQHQCKGIHSCNSETIEWHWKNYQKLKEKNKNHKLFTPYTERCVDSYVSHQLEEPFALSHSLGANSAPLTARAHHLQPRLHSNLLEVFPRLSFWRMGSKLKLTKSNLRFYKHAVRGQTAREQFIEELIDQNIIFIYEQDIQKILSKTNAFDAFICAITAYLKFKDQTEEPPRSFPESEGWITFPKKTFEW